MFEIGFSELMVIMVVALIVIGPERLPKVARAMGSMWGRMQRYVQSVKSDIANDIAIEEAKQLRSTIGKEITAIEQATLQARIEIEQKVLDAQLGRTSLAADDEQKPPAAPSATPSKPV